MANKAAKCRFLLPNGRCERDKRRKCDFNPDKLVFTDQTNTIEIGEICGAFSIFGNYLIEITAEQIEDLKAGKVLCYMDEYGIFIKMNTEEQTKEVHTNA